MLQSLRLHIPCEFGLLDLVRVSFNCAPAPILKEFWPKALMKTPSSYLFSDYLEFTD
jgi:hypothetical protein